jgi:hypothetical protein
MGHPERWIGVHDLESVVQAEQPVWRLQHSLSQTAFAGNRGCDSGCHTFVIADATGWDTGREASLRGRVPLGAGSRQPWSLGDCQLDDEPSLKLPGIVGHEDVVAGFEIDLERQGHPRNEILDLIDQLQ